MSVPCASYLGAPRMRPDEVAIIECTLCNSRDLWWTVCEPYDKSERSMVARLQVCRAIAS
jgi:hypothetical protein